jgi:hypothetical protein
VQGGKLLNYSEKVNASLSATLRPYAFVSEMYLLIKQKGLF